MATSSSSRKILTEDVRAPRNVASPQPVEIEVALLTGGFDKPYAVGLAMALASEGVCLDVIGSDDVDSPEMHATPKLRFLNLRGSKQAARLPTKASRVLAYYARLIRYATIAEARLFHILWNNKFQFFDRTLLMLYYKLLGKKIVFTAHNVNAGKRDSNDSLLNRLTLRLQYLFSDHIFVHTDMMKSELFQDFGVPGERVSVIPFGINNSVPDTDLTSVEAKQRLNVGTDERTILFFGNIRPYKGLDYLVEAVLRLNVSSAKYRLIIAGKPTEGSEKYLDEIQRTISRAADREQIMLRIQFIPDEETELYFKGADVLVLPYTHVFQSGVLFLAYNFGLPVVATDVGSLREEIIQGRTGFLCNPCDAADLAKAIERYFESDLFRSLDTRRQEIKNYATAEHSWATVGEITRHVYEELLAEE